MTDYEHTEFDRDEFEIEFGSFDELLSFMMMRGRALSFERARVGDYVVQIGPLDDCYVQIAHKSFKGNIARLEDGDDD